MVSAVPPPPFHGSDEGDCAQKFFQREANSFATMLSPTAVRKTRKSALFLRERAPSVQSLLFSQETSIAPPPGDACA